MKVVLPSTVYNKLSIKTKTALNWKKVPSRNFSAVKEKSMPGFKGQSGSSVETNAYG